MIGDTRRWIRRTCWAGDPTGDGRGGVVLIPAFAVGRTETVLLHLSRLRDRGELPDVPIFLNSPMAVDVAAIYRRHPDEHRLEADGSPACTRSRRRSTRSTSRSSSISAAARWDHLSNGMLTGGRILHHLVAYGPDHRNAIVLTGYQAGGTRGSSLLAGERSLRIFGKDVPIRAEVVAMDTMSAHADADGLLSWMGAVADPPRVGLRHARRATGGGHPPCADQPRTRLAGAGTGASRSGGAGVSVARDGRHT